MTIFNLDDKATAVMQDIVGGEGGNSLVSVGDFMAVLGDASIDVDKFIAFIQSKTEDYDKISAFYIPEVFIWESGMGATVFGNAVSDSSSTLDSLLTDNKTAIEEITCQSAYPFLYVDTNGGCESLYSLSNYVLLNLHIDFTGSTSMDEPLTLNDIKTFVNFAN